MVLQTTTRGVGRVQKIQNGTILEQIEKKFWKDLSCLKIFKIGQDQVF